MRHGLWGVVVLSLLSSCAPNTRGLACAVDSDCALDGLVCEFDSGRCISPAGIGFGGKVAYVSNRSGKYEVWVMNDDGSARRRIAFGAEKAIRIWGAFQPRWSPDGQELMFYYGMQNESEDIPPASRVMRADADGSGMRELSADYTISGSQISWSADAEALIASTGTACEENITRVDLLSGEHLSLIEQTADGYSSMISPDANPADEDLLAFEAYNCGGDHGGVRLLRIAEQAVSLVSNPDEGPALKPRWAADGRRLLWVGNQAALIHLSEPQTGQTRRIEPKLSGAAEVITEADWTDGGFVFSLVDGPYPSMWICDEDGLKARPILQELVTHMEIDWGPGPLPAWSESSCAVHGGRWAADGLGAQACWFAGLLEQSCTEACLDHGLSCDPGDWNDNIACDLCGELTGEPKSPANNPSGDGGAPYMYEPSGTSHGCYYRREGKPQDCDVGGGSRIRVCVCRPFD